MKRLLLMIGVFMASFFLAGCEFLPDEVIEQASEELCREDPDNPLCDVENMEDLEDQVVIELFDQVKAQYANEDLSERCGDLFSEKNSDLLDRCRNEANSLFPDGIEDYEVEGVEETEEYYIITIYNAEDNQRYTFSLLIDGDSATDLRISGWSFEETTSALLATEEEIIDQVELFLEDFANPDLSIDEVCAKWIGEDQDCDDAGLADNRVKFKAGAELSKTVNILDPDSDDDGIDDGMEDFEVAYEFRGHVTVLKLSLQVLVEEGQVKIELIDSQIDHNLTEESARLLDAFLADFGNFDLSIEEVCAKWTGEDQDCDGDALASNRVKFKAGADLSKTVNIQGPDTDGDGLMDLAIEYEFRGHVTVLKLSVQTSMNNEQLSLQIKDTSIETILQEQTAQALDAFISDLQDETIPTSEVCRTWFDGIDDDCDGDVVDDLSLARGKFKAGAELSKSVNAIDPDSDDDGLFDGVLELRTDDALTCVNVSFKEVITEDSRNIVLTKLTLRDGGGDCDDDDREIFPGEVSKVVQDFFTAYNNLDVTKEELSVFFGIELTEEYMLMRDRLIGSGTRVVFVDLVGPVDLETFILVYDLETPDGTSREDGRLTVRAAIDKATPLIYTELISGHDDDDDGDGILTAEEMDFVQGFQGGLTDTQRPLEEVCKAYVGTMDSCPILEEGEEIVEASLLETNAGILFRIKKRPDLLTGEWDYNIDTYRIYLYTNSDGQEVLDLVPSLDFSYEEEVSRQFQTVLDGLADETVLLDEVCASLSNNSQVYCPELREQLVNLQPRVLETMTVYVEEEEYIELSVEYGSADLSTMTFRVRLMRDRETLRQVIDFTVVE